jgi:hypothetical protein
MCQNCKVFQRGPKTCETQNGISISAKFMFGPFYLLTICKINQLKHKIETGL